ncbi:tRNA (5-methylaminomethyl-2-thiouridine)(34)-methyltransferase MnmD [Gracilimonas amylolytica]|uniref:tRNA (5-methylaminomethyl-2-thiouridine)(34)-methyltransferase MnmD n=1 Tax=Gracilimonas amylolytica TaxID=1749045 RepID=UPI000CD982B9|nr:tRNA (5-methylaminomethyl-2-thiouridine)(34)-methyltransferase MnmD [Gracilimonas amylolytica]
MSQHIHTTKDGSSTLFSEKFDQYYHNPNGAASESLYVFFEQSGLFRSLEKSDSLTVLEIGFGTGLNFLLLADHLKQNHIQTSVDFYSVEAYPISKETATDINFTDHISDPEITDALPQIFDSLKPGMNTFQPFDDLELSLHLFNGFFEDFNPSKLSADFIFHDAFSPEVNAELWSDETFNKLAGYSHSDTILTTYCAASKARAAMCVANWYVAKTRGALGKREMTIASRSEEKLNDFKRLNESRLAERYLNGDFE